MSEIEFLSELNEYKRAKIFPIDSEKSRIEFSFDIAKVDCLKPFILLDYFPPSVISVICDGYSITSGIDIELSSRVEIIGRLLTYPGGWAPVLKDHFKISCTRESLNTVTTGSSIKDIYVTMLAMDCEFLKGVYLQRSAKLFAKIESSVLFEMKKILEKISTPIDEEDSKNFVEFEINTLGQRLKGKELLEEIHMPLLRKEAQRRLAPKVSSLSRRMR